MYALFEGNKQIGSAFSTEKEVWEAALIEGLVTDVPVADEPGGKILPDGYHVEDVGNADARKSCEKAKDEPRYALFRGATRLTGTFATADDVLKTALAEGLMPRGASADTYSAQRLPAEYHIEKVEEPYDPQPGWHLPREVS